MKRFYRKQGSEEEFREQGTGQRERFDNPELEQNIFEQSQKQGFEEPLDKKQQALQIAVKKVREFREKEKRLPRKDEYEQISENIFSQLQKQEARATPEQKQGQARQAGTGRIPRTKEARDAARQKQPSNAGGRGFAQPVQESETGIKIKELLKEAEETKPRDFSDESEEEKEDVGEEELGDNFSLSDLETGEGKESSGEGKCPNCGKTAEEIIFCPECGAAFCENCAKTERIGSEKKIVCPKCGKTIKK